MCTVLNACINAWASLISRCAKARLLYATAAGEKAEATKGLRLFVRNWGLADWRAGFAHWICMILYFDAILTRENSLVHEGGDSFSTGTKLDARITVVNHPNDLQQNFWSLRS